ncbi:uncharacterized protein LOC128559213 [Mercenaria mercenaria]|uniref:uncharacterized protein LOC128559213 n=1 Tax=Mercenaria mercenaria TaxID=6596 RepID=UPI00234EF07C|nr:uncharacterized protein LOC128559213 [Mercenaria mercenaria]
MTNVSIIKQRTTIWHEERNKMKVTGSSIFQAIGCDTLKSQKEHFGKVVNGMQPMKSSDIQQQAMQHGTESEIHQIATMCGVIMPFLFPDLVFNEEGFYKSDGKIVSPDRSLKNSDQVAEYAFEGKAPVEKTFTTTVHYKVPSRYVTQTIFEQKVLNAKGGTLYMSWTPKSCSLFKLLPDEKICDSVLEEIHQVYMKDNPKWPTRISEQARQIKKDLTKASEITIFLGEFPSVQGRFQDNPQDSDNTSPYVIPNTKEILVSPLTYDDLQRHLLLGEEVIKDAYEFNREIASQVVVYLIADLNRLWKKEEPHAVPVTYFYRGHSLSMDIMRKITESCKDVCRSNGLDIVASAADGEFTPIIVRGRQGNPLTQHQLAKDVWKEVCLLTKSEILKRLVAETQNFTESREPWPDRDNPGEIRDVRCVRSEGRTLERVQTPVKGWIQEKTMGKNRQQIKIIESVSLVQENTVCESTQVDEVNDGGPHEDGYPINHNSHAENQIKEATSNEINEMSQSPEFITEVAKLLIEKKTRTRGHQFLKILYLSISCRQNR